MFLKSWPVIVALLVSVLWASGSPAADAPPSFKERWQLEFFPEELPDQSPLLCGTAWVKAGDMNILGMKTDLVIRFPQDRRTEFTPFPPAEPRGEAENGMNSVRQPVEFSSISHPGFGNEPITETTQIYRQSVIAGPCLEYGGQVRTFHVVRDKQFLLDAVVPVNPLQWYTVQVQLSGRPGPQGRPPRDGHVRVTEFLYEFGEDPLKADEGPLTIHYHSRNSSHETATTTHFHTKFRKEPPPKYTSGVRHISTGLTPLLFILEHNVAVTAHNYQDQYDSEAFLPLTKTIEE